MNTLKYIIYLIKGQFTAKVVSPDAMTEAEYLAAVAAASGKTIGDINAVLGGMKTVHIALGKTGRGTDSIADFFRVTTNLGGVYPTNDPDASLIRPNVSQSIASSTSVDEAIRTDIHVEKVGEKTQMAPEIDSILGQTGNALDKYGHGTTGGTQVNGDHFREVGADATWPLAHLVNQDGSNPIALSVIQCSPTKLVLGPAPAGTTGVKRLRITATYGAGAVVNSIALIAPLPAP